MKVAFHEEYEREGTPVPELRLVNPGIFQPRTIAPRRGWRYRSYKGEVTGELMEASLPATLFIWNIQRQWVMRFYTNIQNKLYAEKLAIYPCDFDSGLCSPILCAQFHKLAVKECHDFLYISYHDIPSNLHHSSYLLGASTETCHYPAPRGLVSSEYKVKA